MRAVLTRHAPVALFGSLFLAAFVWACSDGTEAEDETAAPASITTTTSASSPTLVPTEPNLKVAFIGDTGTGDDFKSVLRLIKREGADLVMIQGDLNYSFGGSAAPWFDVADAEIDVPYFIAKGNHDSDWNGYGRGLQNRLANWGIPADHQDPTKRNYSLVYKGLKVVMVSDSETSPTKRADYVKERLANDDHVWRICSWHKNQRAANVGPKGDEMGWEIYENCRNGGAIVAQGHSHTYSRSKTLTNDGSQTIDASCRNPFDLCVSPGRHFFFDSSVGGQDVRSPNTTIAGRPHWASSVTGSFGALFIEFNVGGDPNKATGYFKSTAGVVLDPPASSGRTTFTITRTP